MRIINCNPYKNRLVFEGDMVSVYRNLNKDSLTIKKGDKVNGHAHLVVLENVSFYVSMAGNERVNKERVKNVHAYLKGLISDAKDIDLNLLKEFYKLLEKLGYSRVYYNPYKVDSFVYYDDFKPIKEAEKAIVIMDRIYVI